MPVDTRAQLASQHLQPNTRGEMGSARGGHPLVKGACTDLLGQSSTTASHVSPLRSQTNALAAYQRQVERAQEAERKREEADRRWREVGGCACCTPPLCCGHLAWQICSGLGGPLAFAAESRLSLPSVQGLGKPTPALDACSFLTTLTSALLMPFLCSDTTWTWEWILRWRRLLQTATRLRRQRPSRSSRRSSSARPLQPPRQQQPLRPQL